MDNTAQYTRVTQIDETRDEMGSKRIGQDTGGWKTAILQRVQGDKLKCTQRHYKLQETKSTLQLTTQAPTDNARHTKMLDKHNDKPRGETKRIRIVGEEHVGRNHLLTTAIKEGEGEELNNKMILIKNKG